MTPLACNARVCSLVRGYASSTHPYVYTCIYTPETHVLFRERDDIVPCPDSQFADNECESLWPTER